MDEIIDAIVDGFFDGMDVLFNDRSTAYKIGVLVLIVASAAAVLVLA